MTNAVSSDPLQGLMVSASGVRGIVGQTLTPEVVLRVAAAHASCLEPGPIVVGRDTRPSGAWVSRLTQAALLASGHDVIDVGVAPTPTILYAIRHHGAAGGIAITASHNPAPWNALKLFGPGGTFLAPAQSDEVARRARQGGATWVPNDQVGGFREDPEAIRRHRQFLGVKTDEPFLAEMFIHKSPQFVDPRVGSRERHGTTARPAHGESNDLNGDKSKQAAHC